MKILEWKRSKSVRNLYQALDRAIAFYFENLPGDGEVKIITEENQFPMYNTNTENRFVLEVYGFTTGPVSVTVEDEQRFIDALQKMKFEDLSLFSHFFLREKTGDFEKIEVFRISKNDRYVIAAGYF